MDVEFWVRYLATWAIVAAIVLGSAARLGRRWPARMRISLAFAAFGLAVLPTFGPLFPELAPGPAAKVEVGAIRSMPPSQTEAQLGGPATSRPEPATVTTQRSPVSLELILLAVWPILAAFLIIRLAVDVAAMNRLVKEATVSGKLRHSPEVTTPVVAGWPRSAIMVPPDWPSGYTAEESEAIVRHEDAHLRGQHLSTCLIAEFFVAVFWWTPGSRRLRDSIREALEELADHEVARTEPLRLHLASALLKASEVALRRGPSFCPGVVSESSDITRRIERLIRGETVMYRKPITAFVGLAVFVFAGGALALVASASQKDANYGMTVGATWTWSIRSANAKDSTYTLTASKLLQVKGRAVMECTSQYDKYIVYTYIGLDKDGLWEWHNSGMRGPGVAADVPPEPFLRFPLETGKTWTWTSPFRGQTMGDVDWDKLKSACTAKVVSTNESIKVPAGTFTTVHVVVEKKSEGMGDRRTEMWYSPTVGLVKQVDEYPTDGSGQGRSERLLLKYTAK